MSRFEYKSIVVNPPRRFFLTKASPVDLDTTLNQEASDGWRVVQVFPLEFGLWMPLRVLLERPVDD